MEPTTTRNPNRLVHEKSPYLLQHAYNPVDWYPWGEEAFDTARREQKPIFLSIGYSTCHWCHVMEKESFESEAVAAQLNRWFVPVKVDREERPDVDRLYMTSLQAMGEGGGWPLTAILTPNLEPFFGGTYFPPDARWGRPGLNEILPAVHDAWTRRRDEMQQRGALLLRGIAAAVEARGAAAAEVLSDAVRLAARAALLDRCEQTLAHAYDRNDGGFGSAPKFPSASNLNFLARYWSRDPVHRERALEMARRQLDVMQAGGIHDHLGGGFHRYSTDARWLVPHFEKMLYDQAQLATAYLDASQIARQPGPGADAARAAAYAETARGILAYVERDLGSDEGGFYSAEDADSEGKEGKFYVWTRAEIASILGEEMPLFEYAYGVAAEGNFEHGLNILHRAHSDGEVAERFGIAPARRLEQARAVLLAARSKRIRPHRDDKVLASWNGLMISAFANAARVLEDPALGERAERAAEFVWRKLRDPRTGELRRRYRDGEAAGAGQLDDHAFLARGCLELYLARHDPRWLERAVELTQQALDRFRDERDGGWFESPAGDPHVAIRLKSDFDGAEPAGGSVAAWVLQALAGLLDREPWRQAAERLLDLHAARLAEYPAAMPQMLVAMDLAQTPPRHIVIAGDPEAADTRALEAVIDRRFLPRDVLLVVGPDTRARLSRLAPFVGGLAPRDGRATAHVCESYACKLPVTEPGELAAQLEAP